MPVAILCAATNPFRFYDLNVFLFYLKCANIFRQFFLAQFWFLLKFVPLSLLRDAPITVYVPKYAVLCKSDKEALSTGALCKNLLFFNLDGINKSRSLLATAEVFSCS